MICLLNELGDPLLGVKLLVLHLLSSLYLLSKLILAHHAILCLDLAPLCVSIIVVRHALILLLCLFDPQFVLDLLVEILKGLLLLPTLVVLLRLVQVWYGGGAVALGAKLALVLGVLRYQLVG